MIYFILAPELNRVKIGLAQKPWERLSKLQTDCPCDVQLVAFIQGDLAAEQALHQRFAQQRVRGEWFNLIGPLLDYVATLDAAKPLPKRQSRLKPMAEASGLGKGHLSAIVNGKRKAALPTLFHIFKTTGWKHPRLQDVDDAVLLGLADKMPYRSRKAA